MAQAGLFMAQKFKYIIFDWDNTLADSWDCIHLAMMDCFDKCEIPRAWHDIASTKHHGQGALRSYFPDLFGDKSDKATRIFYEFYEANYRQFVKKIAHSDELMQFLHQHMTNWGVISNKRGDYLRAELTNFGWFQANPELLKLKICGSRDYEFDKPDARLWQLYRQANEIACENQQILYVGDMQVDANFAQNCAIKCAIIGDANIQCDYNFLNLQELRIFLTKYQL